MDIAQQLQAQNILHPIVTNTLNDIISKHIKNAVREIQGLGKIYDYQTTESYENRQIMQAIKHSTTELQEKITDLQIILNEYAKHPPIINKVDLLENISNSFRLFLAKPNIIVNIASKPNPCEVESSALYIQSIFSELAHNAYKFKKPQEMLQIDISIDDLGSFFEVTFKDNGVGMNIADLNKTLFEPYCTFHNNSGKGLGLFYLKLKADKLGIKISVKSDKNEGTAYKLLIPKKNNSEEASNYFL